MDGWMDGFTIGYWCFHRFKECSMAQALPYAGSTITVTSRYLSWARLDNAVVLEKVSLLLFSWSSWRLPRHLMLSGRVYRLFWPRSRAAKEVRLPIKLGRCSRQLSWTSSETRAQVSGVSILMSYGENPHYVKLPIFSEFMENSTKFMKNSDLTKWTQNLR